MRNIRYKVISIGIMLVLLLSVVSTATAVSTGSITGKVTNENGQPLSNITAAVYSLEDFGWWLLGSSSTDGYGNYSIGGLDSGNYKVTFRDSAKNYVEEYYDNKPAIELEDADWVQVTDSQITPNIDAVLAKEKPIKLTGKVTKSNDQPIIDARVGAYKYSSEYASWREVDSAYTDENGDYVFRGLDSGDYKIKFYDGAGNFSEYYDDKSNLENANIVTISDDKVTSGIDAKLNSAGQISGHITDINGTSINRSIRVEAYKYSEEYGYPYWKYAGYDFTDTNGNYSIAGLDTDNYKVSFFEGSGLEEKYAPEYFNDKSDLYSADLVPVTSGQETWGIDAALAPTAKITGKVTNSSGGPITSLVISVYKYVRDDISGEWNWRSIGSTSYANAQSGNYSISGLSAGSYKVEFSDWSGNYAREYYNDKLNQDSADIIVLGASQIISGLDIQLAPAGKITGKVTNNTGDSIEDITIDIYSANGDYITSTGTESGGTYSVGGLNTGMYKLSFQDWSNNLYLDEWYNNKSDLDTADPVFVTAGQITPNIDVQLLAKADNSNGSITGQVTDTNGKSLNGIGVGAYIEKDGNWEFVGNEYGYYDTTNQDGNYTITGLKAGSYKIEFSNWDYVAEYYNDKPDLASADQIIVNEAQATTNINAQLAKVGENNPPPNPTPAPSPNPTPTPTPNPTITILNTNLSLSAKPKSVNAGKAATLSGQLKDSSGKAVAGKVVNILVKVQKIIKKKVKGKIKIIKKWVWKKIASKTTDTNGNFSLKLKPKQVTTYKAEYSGDAGYKASSSNAVKVSVKKVKKKKKK